MLEKCTQLLNNSGWQCNTAHCCPVPWVAEIEMVELLSEQPADPITFWDEWGICWHGYNCWLIGVQSHTKFCVDVDSSQLIQHFDIQVGWTWTASCDDPSGLAISSTRQLMKMLTRHQIPIRFLQQESFGLDCELSQLLPTNKDFSFTYNSFTYVTKL